MSEAKQEPAESRYSLWSIPESEWRTPFTEKDVPTNLMVHIEELRDQPIPSDERLAAFTTPVTPEALRTPTQGKRS